MSALWEKYTEEELREFYNKSNSFKEFYQLVGYKGIVNSSTTKAIKEKYSWFIDKRNIAKAGQVYGRLKLIKKDPNNKDKWICECKCGNTLSAYTSNILRGLTTSCGCKRKETAAKHARELNQERSEHYINKHLGNTYGQLKILCIDEEKTKKYNRNYVLCKCNCGCNNVVSIRLDCILTGNTTSCGTTKSRGNMIINSILQLSNINYKKEVSFDDLVYEKALKFDFGIYDINNKLLCLIEYQGEQHYKACEHFGGEENFRKQQNRDNLKREYCRKNNIPLIEIPYTDFKKLSVDYLCELMKGAIDERTFDEMCKLIKE